MNDLNDIVFNPETGLFESKTNITAHLTERQIRGGSRRSRMMDPARAALKPVIVAFRVEGGYEHKVGSEVCVRWRVANAQKIVIHFHNHRELEYGMHGTLRFFMPDEDCKVRLIAMNRDVKTQSTISLISRCLTLFDRLFGQR